MVFDDDDPLPGFDPRAQTQRVFQTQVVICSLSGLLIFLLFCFLRSRLPQIYEIRSFRIKNQITPMPASFFGWMKTLYNISDAEVLENSGLDNFVYLSFFKLCIKTLSTISVLAIFILSPIRYYYTGRYDRDGISWAAITESFHSPTKADPNPGADPMNESYLWVYAIFTYVFTILVVFFTLKESLTVIRTRQEYLGSQNSITDRTIRVSHIPSHLMSETALKNHIEEISVGKVIKVNMIFDYSTLKKLFDQRKRLLDELESMYSRRYGLSVKIFSRNPSSTLKCLPHDVDLDSLPYQLRYVDSETGVDETSTLLLLHATKKPVLGRSKWPFRSLSKDWDANLRLKITQLIRLDNQILEAKEKHEFHPIGVAFVTMDSVASAQMCAQLIFSSNIMELITVLLPSPVDINWENFAISVKGKILKKNVIQLLILIVSLLLIFPISYIAKLLNVKTIKKIWPDFGDYLIENKWMSTIITGFLPTYLLTLINVCLPYLISYLTQFEGMISKGDTELSVIKKNFIYIFFNFFLVFTLFGTLSNYWALLTDTTKIAYLLASSIKNLALFYVDLILLQGMIMFPFKLIQIDVLCLLFWKIFVMRKYQTPRSLRNLIYKPSIFDFGLILPQHMLIFIITLIYSVISTKIVASGVIYFVFGYYVYKYQLMYSTVHLRHSTGKCWPIIVRRICIGLLFLQLTMLGTLALEQSYFLAAFVVPLLPLTMLLMFRFEKNFEPLLKYVALQSIFEGKSNVNNEDLENAIANDTNDTFSSPNTSLLGSPVQLSIPGSSFLTSATTTTLASPRLRKRRSTIEEERELFQDYVYPLLNDQLDGPWIGFEGDYVNFMKYEQRENYSSTGGEGSNIVSRVIRKINTKAEYD